MQIFLFLISAIIVALLYVVATYFFGLAEDSTTQNDGLSKGEN